MSSPRHTIEVDGQRAEIGSAGELAVVLDVLHGREDRAVLEQLRDHLPEILAGGRALIAVLRSLSHEDQVFLLKTLGSRLRDVVDDARTLRDVLSILATEEAERALLDGLGSEGLRGMIDTAEQLAEVLEWVYGHCDELPIELLGREHVNGMIRDGQEAAVVLRAMSPASQRELFDAIGMDRMLELVRDGRDLAALVRALPAEESVELLRRYDRSALVRLIGNRDDWDYLCRRLEPAEADQLFAKLGVTPGAP
jgi:hypothetical protein